MGCSFGRCLWVLMVGGHNVGSWGAPGGARGVLVQHKRAHHSAKGGMQVLVDAHGVLVGAHGVLIWRVMAHHLAKGRLFSQGEGGGEVSDKDERENTVEPLNKLSHVQGMSTSCQMQQGT